MDVIGVNTPYGGKGRHCLGFRVTTLILILESLATFTPTPTRAICSMRLRMLNGIGGSADSLRSAKISIMCMPSTRPSKIDPTGVSWIVPMYTHVNQKSTVSKLSSQVRHETIILRSIDGLACQCCLATSLAFHLESVDEWQSKNAHITI